MSRKKDLKAYSGHAGDMCISCKGKSSSVGQVEHVLPSTKSYPPYLTFTIVFTAEHENGISHCL